MSDKTSLTNNREVRKLDFEKHNEYHEELAHVVTSANTMYNFALVYQKNHNHALNMLRAKAQSVVDREKARIKEAYEIGALYISMQTLSVWQVVDITFSQTINIPLPPVIKIDVGGRYGNQVEGEIIVTRAKEPDYTPSIELYTTTLGFPAKFVKSTGLFSIANGGGTRPINDRDLVRVNVSASKENKKVMVFGEP